MSTSGEYFLYKVKNRINGDFYIGVTSRSVKKRWDEHVKHARHKVNNGHFYRAINKYGPDNFVLETICKEISRNGAVEAEILLILDMNPAYNSTIGGDGTWGHKVSPEGRQRMSDVNKGNKYNLGRKWSDTQKLEMSKKKTGCAPPPVSEKMQENRANNMRKAAALRRKRVLCINDSVIYESLRDAAASYALNKSGISHVCLGKRNSIFGLKFQYIGGEN